MTHRPEFSGGYVTLSDELGRIFGEGRVEPTSPEDAPPQGDWPAFVGGSAPRPSSSPVIHPTAVVETDEIGPYTVIGPHAYVSAHVEIGAACVIGPGACIGMPGFGYEYKEATDSWATKPHRFGVVLKDGVHVGANTCIDRGSWRDTLIERGTKIDNLVHIAHNVIIGRSCIVVAQAMIAGSVTIYPGAWIGPCASIRQRLTIGSNAFIGMGAVVVTDVPVDAVMAGVPAKFMRRRTADDC